MEVPAVLLQADNEPELRHRHHDRHPTQHDDDGDGAPRRARAVDGGTQLHQPALYRRLHPRVRHETGSQDHEQMGTSAAWQYFIFAIERIIKLDQEVMGRKNWTDGNEVAVFLPLFFFHHEIASVGREFNEQMGT